MKEVIDQYGARHRFSDEHFFEVYVDALQVSIERDDEVCCVARFPNPARYGEVSEDSCLSMREVPHGIAARIKELEAQLAAVTAERNSYVQGCKIQIPTQTMEYEFANHYRRGYDAATATCGKQLAEHQEKLTELQALLAKKDEALHKCSAQLARLGYSANHADEALALTSPSTALRQHDAELLRKVPKETGHYILGNDPCILAADLLDLADQIEKGE